MKAVKFDHYGDIDVLEVRDVPRPSPGPNEVLVQVKAAGINPGEAMIRKGALHDRWPATFPSGQGSDLAGVVAEAGAGVQTFNAGDEVLGFTHQRASQAEFVVVPANQLTGKPPAMSWEVAGALSVAGTTAYAAIHAVDLKRGNTVAVAARREAWVQSQCNWPSGQVRRSSASPARPTMRGCPATVSSRSTTEATSPGA
jgi:NADPH:quinone reductase-like Zn-dependent oxidoreductase